MYAPVWAWLSALYTAYDDYYSFADLFLVLTVGLFVAFVYSALSSHAHGELRFNYYYCVYMCVYVSDVRACRSCDEWQTFHRETKVQCVQHQDPVRWCVLVIVSSSFVCLALLAFFFFLFLFFMEMSAKMSRLSRNVNCLLICKFKRSSVSSPPSKQTWQTLTLTRKEHKQV